MRSLFSTLFVFALLAVAFASPSLSPTDSDVVGACDGFELCPSLLLPDDLVPRHVDAQAGPSTTSWSRSVFGKRSWTNAERLARGLPLLPPTRRSQDSARRSTPSSAPQLYKRGILKVVGSSNNIIGYVSNTPLSGYAIKYDTTSTNALIISVPFTTGTTSASTVHITMENASNGFALLGLIQGRDDPTADIGPGSFNYLYFGGVAEPGTAAGLPASISFANAFSSSKGAESDVWNIDFVTGAVSPQWINTDSSSPNMLLFSQGTALYAGSDSIAFHSKYPSPITPFTLVFVEI